MCNYTVKIPVAYWKAVVDVMFKSWILLNISTEFDKSEVYPSERK